MSGPQNHADRAHARFAPSAAYRWMRCHGSIAASESFEDTPSIYAQEGTECHEAAAEILMGNAGFDKATQALSDEQRWIVDEYVNYVVSTLERLEEKFGARNVRAIFEKRMHAPAIHPEFFGTGDTQIIASRTLGFVDLKAGNGKVLVRDADGRINPQQGAYLLLALAELGVAVGPWDGRIDLDAIGLSTLRMTIFQPKVFGDEPQTTVVKVRELEDFRDELCDAIDAIEQGDKTRVAGEWCKFCPARAICPTQRQARVEGAKFTFGEVENYPLEVWAEILEEAEMLSAHLANAKAHVHRALEKGKRIDGWKLVAKRARKNWIDPDAAARILEKVGLDRDEIYSKKLVSPAAAKTLLKLRKSPFDLKPLFESKSSGPTLARADDPRAEILVSPGAVFASFDDDGGNNGTEE